MGCQSVGGNVAVVVFWMFSEAVVEVGWDVVLCLLSPLGALPAPPSPSEIVDEGCWPVAA